MPQIKLSLKQTPLLSAYFCRLPGVTLAVSQNLKPKYYRPSSLTGELASEYQRTLDWILRYKKTLQKKPELQFLANSLTSYSELVDIELTADTKVLLQITERFSLINDKYYLSLTRSLEEICRQRTNSQFAMSLSDSLKQNLPSARDSLQLIQVEPKNEFDLVVQNGFQFIEQTSAELEASFDKLKYSAKLKLLKKLAESTSLKSEPRYRFEIVTEPSAIDSLQNSSDLVSLDRQNLSPYYGYEVPDDLDETVAEMLTRCFDMSYELYSKLVADGYSSLAQLAVLFGHRQHFAFSVGTSSLKQLLAKPADTLAEKIVEAIAEKHPSLVEILRTDLTSVNPASRITATLSKDSDRSLNEK